MTLHHTPTLKIHEYSARAIRPDTKPRVVLVHGALDRSTSFVRMVKLLINLGVDCISYDRRGYNDSPLGPPFSSSKVPTIDDHVEDLAQIIGDRPSVVFGHSLGGTIALLLAEQNRSPIRALVTFESPIPWMEFWEKEANYGMELEDLSDPTLTQNHAEQFMVKMIGTERWNALHLSVRERRRNEGTILVSEMATAKERTPALDPSRILVPAIVAYGSTSPQKYRLAADYLQTTLPNAKTAIVEHTDHGVHLANPTEAVRLIELAYAAISYQDSQLADFRNRT